MKSRDTLVRLKRFQAEEKRRRVAQIEAMINEFSRMAGDLDREISLEEQRSNNADPAHFAYSTYARAARARRDNLKQSADELRVPNEAVMVSARWLAFDDSRWSRPHASSMSYSSGL